MRKKLRGSRLGILSPSPIVFSQLSPEAVEAPTLTPEAWKDYCARVWVARLDAHMHSRYFGMVRRRLGWIGVTLQLAITLGSAGAVASLLHFLPSWVGVVVGLVAAFASAMLQITKLPEKVQQAGSLKEAWWVRSQFWDEAYNMIRNQQYLGPLPELTKEERPLVQLEEQLGFVGFKGSKERIMNETEKADVFAAPLLEARNTKRLTANGV